MYTIKRAARATGVPETTLRAWERRYHLITPHRTSAGYRLYDEDALARIRAMRGLIDGGLAAAQAASQVVRADVDLASLIPNTRVDVRTNLAPTPPRRGIDRASGRDLVARLTLAAQRMSPTEASAALDEAFAERSFESVVDHLLMPALSEIGRGWARGRIDVAGEHLVSAAVHRRLSAHYEAAACETGQSQVVVGLPPGSRHELGILSFAVALRRRGLPTAYLGADVPTDSWAAVVAEQGASVAVLALPSDGDVVHGSAVIESLSATSTTICVGGAFQDLAPAPAVRLGHSIAAGAATVESIVRATGAG